MTRGQGQQNHNDSVGDDAVPEHSGLLPKKKALFLCTHNSSRSQMAAALLSALHGGHWDAASAGTDPRGVHPDAITVMSEIGIDISRNRSRHVDTLRDQHFDVVVTVCDGARETCPIFPGGAKKIHRGFPDPAAATGTPEERRNCFRRVRDEIRAWLATEPLFKSGYAR